MNHDAIPRDLTERDNWMCWRYVERDGKRTKVPICARSGQSASATDSATWSSYEVAASTFARDGTVDGIGFVFTAADPFCGIDLDECIDEDGRIADEARRIIDECASYAEISPSGRGVKIFIRAKKPDTARCRSKVLDGLKEVEIYDQGRFFTVTAQAVEGAATPGCVKEAQEALDALCARLWPPASKRKPVTRSAPLNLDDGEVIRLAAQAKNGAAFMRLMDGCLDDHGGDHSAADAALCCHLVFWCGGDVEQIDRIFRTSGLYREKWDRDDYRDRTINSALETTTERYTGRCHQNGHTQQHHAHSEPSGGGMDSAMTHIETEVAIPDTAPDTDPHDVSTLLTDVGNAGRLVRREGKRIRYCFGRGQWLIWDGKRWRPDDRGRIVKLCKATALAIYDEAKRDPVDQDAITKWAKTSQRRDRLSAMAALAQPEVAVLPDDMDADPWAFNCRNGTVDLRTGELRPHRREDLITKLAPVEYDPDASCLRFDRFLNEIFDGDRDLIRFVQRWHGHSLSGDIREQYLPIYHGEGNNGKSVLLDTICAVMGEYAGEAPPDLVTVRKHPEHPTEIADLMGKRLVIASETERDAELRLQLIKRLTGNARLKARMMRQDYFEFARTHKMILVTNNRPTITEDTEAAWRRLRLVPFDVVIPKSKRDPDLMRKLSAERSGILAWLVRGCVDWLREGLTEPNAVIVATEAYRGCANSLDAFLLDRCVLGEGLFCLTSDLMATYADWCSVNKRVPLRGRGFAAALKEKGCMRKKIGGKWHWVGLELENPPSGHNGQNGHELPVDRALSSRVGANGKVMSNVSIVSTGEGNAIGEAGVTAGVADV